MTTTTSVTEPPDVRDFLNATAKRSLKRGVLVLDRTSRPSVTTVRQRSVGLDLAILPVCECRASESPSALNGKVPTFSPSRGATPTLGKRLLYRAGDPAQRPNTRQRFSS